MESITAQMSSPMDSTNHLRKITPVFYKLFQKIEAEGILSNSGFL